MVKYLAFAAALAALSGALGCSEAVVGDAVFVCDDDAPCGAGQTCTPCPAASARAGTSVCAPAGADLGPRCGATSGPDADGGDALPGDADDTSDRDTTDIPDTPDTPDTPDAPDVDTRPTAPPIRPTRTRGPAPLAVVFTVDTIDPLLAYRYDLGDGDARVDAPLAAHVFMTAGRYEVRLVVRDGDGDEETSQVTIEVDAPDFGTPVCFSAVATVEPCPGGGFTLVNGFFDVSMLQSSTKRHILLRRGDRFDSFSAALPAAGEGLIGVYGSAPARPTVVLHGFDALQIESGGWRVRDIAFEGGSADTAIVRADAGTEVTLVNVYQEGDAPLVASEGQVTIADCDTTSGAVTLASGAILGGHIRGPVTATGGPLVVAGAHLGDGLLGTTPSCDGAAVIVGADLRDGDGPAVLAAACPATWVVSASRLEGLDGLRLASANAIVHDNVAVLPGGSWSGARLGRGARAEHNTCYQPAGGGACVTFVPSATDTFAANTLLVAPAGASPVLGPAPTVCAACNVRLDPAGAFAVATPSALADFVPAAATAAIDAGLALPHRHRDAGGRCRPVGGGPDLGAWERDAAPCD